MNMKERPIIGLTENITIFGVGKDKKIKARIDTGATKGSMDVKLAAELNLGPIITSKLVKSAHGSKMRPVIEAEILIHGKKIKTQYTLADRSHLKFRCLIGQNVLKEGFLIDPLKRR